MDSEMKSFLEGFEQRMNVRFDGIDVRLGGIDMRLDAMDARFGSIDVRLNGIDGRLDAIDSRLYGIDVRLDAIDARFDGIDLRLDGIDSRLDHFERNQNDMQEQIAYLVGSFGKFADDMRKLVHAHDVRITNLESRVQFV